jgi:hypothetical protein
MLFFHNGFQDRKLGNSSEYVLCTILDSGKTGDEERVVGMMITALISISLQPPL